MSIHNLFRNQRPSDKESEGGEIAIKFDVIISHLYLIINRYGWEETYNMAASPTCLNCFPQSPFAAFCRGRREKGCGSTFRAIERTRAKTERVRRWERVRRRGVMGAISLFLFLFEREVVRVLYKVESLYRGEWREE